MLALTPVVSELHNTMKQLLILVALCLSCASQQALVVEEVGAPTVPTQEFQVVSQSLTDCGVKLTGSLEAPAALTMEKATFELVVDGTVLKSGEQPLGIAVAAGQSGTFTLEQTFTYVKDTEELKAMDARGGSLLVAIRGNIVTTIAGKSVLVPFAKSKEVRTPRLPHVKYQEYEAGRFSESEVQAVFHVGVVNPNGFELSLTNLGYQVTIAGKKVKEDVIGAGERVAPGSTAVFDITATVNEESHGKDVKKLIKGLVLPFVLTGTLKTPLYEEALDAKGDIKLNLSK